MSSPKIVIKTGYMNSILQVLNTLEYAGNKIDKQEVVLTDGTIIPFNDEKINFEKYGLTNVAYIKCFTKDGKKYSFKKEKYLEINSQEELVKVSNIVTTDKELYHEMKDMDFIKYLSYIEGRVGAVKDDGTGLFDLCGNISIDNAREMAVDYDGNTVWSHIISLPENDTRGYDNRKDFADFIRSIAPDIAKIYNISFENLVINGAFHSNTDNAHVHLLMYSKDKTEGFLVGGTDSMVRASEKLKSKFVNGIYKTDVDTLKDLIFENRVSMKSELDKMLDKIYDFKDFDQATKEKFLHLHENLKSYNGRLVYGYLDPDLKADVSDLLYDLVHSSDEFKKVYDELLNCQTEYIKLYQNDETKLSNRLELFEKSFFYPTKTQKTTLHNIIIENAKNYSPTEIFKKATKIENRISDDFKSLENLDFPKNQATKIKNLPYKKFYALENYYAVPDTDFDVYDEYSFLENTVPNDTLYDEIAEHNSSTIFDKRKISSDLAYHISSDCYRAFHTAVNGLLNPLEEKTNLQNDLICLFENLTIDSPKEDFSKIIKILKLDENLKNIMDNSLENNTKRLYKTLGNHPSIAQGIKDYNYFLHKGKKILPMHKTLVKYAENLQDTKYYETLKAHKDLNSDLRKDIFRNASNNFNALKPLFLELKSLSDFDEDFLKDTDDVFYKCTCELIEKNLNLLASEDALSTNASLFSEKIYKFCDEPKKYTKRYEKALYEVPKLLAPHYIPITIAKNLDFFEFNLELRKNDDIKKLNKTITKALYQFILSDSYSSEYIKNSFLDGDISNVFSKIYNFDKDVKTAFDSLEFSDENLGNQFKNHILGIEKNDNFNFNQISNHLNSLAENFDNIICDAVVHDNKNLSDYLKPYLNETLKDVMYSSDFVDFALHIKTLNDYKIELLKTEKIDFDDYNKVTAEIELTMKNYLQNNLYLDDNILDYMDLMCDKIIKTAPKDVSNLFVERMFNSDTKLPINKSIFSFVASIENKYIAQSIKNVKVSDTEAFRDLYKELKSSIYENIEHLQNEINEFSSLEGLDFNEHKEKLSEILKSVLSKINTEELTSMSDDFNGKIEENIIKTAPSGFLDMTLEKFNLFVEKNNIAIPINQIIYHSLTENLEKTYMESVAHQNYENMREFNQKIYSEISKTLYNRKDMELFSLVKNHAAATDILNHILTKNPELNADAILLKENLAQTFNKISNSVPTDEMISDIFLNSSFCGVLSNIEFIGTNTDALIQKINNDKLISALFQTATSIAHLMHEDVDNSHNLSRERQSNLTHSKSKLIRQKTNLSH